MNQGVRREEIKKVLVFSALFVFSLYFLYESLSYPEASRRFPLLVFTVIAVLSLIKILILSANSLGYLNLLQEKNSLFDINVSDISQDAEVEVATQNNTDNSSDLYMILKSITWVIVFTLGFYFFGIITAIPIVLFGFLYIESDLQLHQCIILAMFSSLFMYVMFVEFLGIRIYYGEIQLPFEDFL